MNFSFSLLPHICVKNLLEFVKKECKFTPFVVLGLTIIIKKFILKSAGNENLMWS